jgi:hypothetical protein
VAVTGPDGWFLPYRGNVCVKLTQLWKRVTGQSLLIHRKLLIGQLFSEAWQRMSGNDDTWQVLLVPEIE